MATFTSGIRRGAGQASIAYSNPIAASKHSYTTLPYQELVVSAASGVLSGASGPGGDPLTASLDTPPLHGYPMLHDDGSFTCMPAPGYAGGDSFTYRAVAPSGNYATAQVVLTCCGSSVGVDLRSARGRHLRGWAVGADGFLVQRGGGRDRSLLLRRFDRRQNQRRRRWQRLDTSTIGLHAYTVTVVSKDGLTGSASISCTVVPAPLNDPDEPPSKDPDEPPNDPEGPPLGVELSLGVERTSLPELLRTQKLVVAARVNEAAKVALAGSAKLNAPAGRKVRTKVVGVFESKTVRFVGPGRKKMALTLSRKGSEALRGVPKVRIAIAAGATDEARRVGEEENGADSAAVSARASRARALEPMSSAYSPASTIF